MPAEVKELVADTMETRWVPTESEPPPLRYGENNTQASWDTLPSIVRETIHPADPRRPPPVNKHILRAWEDYEYTEEVQNCVNAKVSRGKSPGPSGVPPDLFVHAPPELKAWERRLFNRCFKEGWFPPCLQLVEVTLAPKTVTVAGLFDAAQMSVPPVRPISSFEVLLKRYEIALNDFARLHFPTTAEQFGFTAHISSLAASIVTRLVTEECIFRSRGCFICDLDMEKGYDRFRWNVAALSYRADGIPEGWIRACGSLFPERQQCYKTAYGNTRWCAPLGLGQGSVLACRHFTQVLAPMLRRLRHMADPVVIGEGQHKVELSATAYVDDLQLMSTTHAGLTQRVQFVVEYLSHLGGRFNALKSDYCAFQPDGKPAPSLSLPSTVFTSGRVITAHGNTGTHKRLGIPYAMQDKHKGVYKMVKAARDRFHRILAHKQLYPHEANWLIHAVLVPSVGYRYTTGYVSDHYLKQLETPIRRLFLASHRHARSIPRSATHTSKAHGGLGLRSLVHDRAIRIVTMAHTLLNTSSIAKQVLEARLQSVQSQWGLPVHPWAAAVVPHSLLGRCWITEVSQAINTLRLRGFANSREEFHVTSDRVVDRPLFRVLPPSLFHRLHTTLAIDRRIPPPRFVGDIATCNGKQLLPWNALTHRRGQAGNQTFQSVCRYLCRWHSLPTS